MATGPSRSDRTLDLASDEAATNRLTFGGRLRRGKPLEIRLNGELLRAYEGETVAAALVGAGVLQLRKSPVRHGHRGVYCGMGICFECLIDVDGRPNVRSCMTPVVDGMHVETGRG
jgi:predicted molibdopterin-dependent oxidoreductase YjgC